jgi:hypothetical protein
MVDSHSNARRLVNRVRTLTRIPRAALLAAAAGCLAACGGSAARSVASGNELPAAAPAVVAGDAEVAGGAPAASPPSVTSTSAPANDTRERQLEILNEAVSALRQEAARSYERTNELARETERLRGLIASLQRRLAKSRDQNRGLLDHIHDLEKKLEEIGTPPPVGVESPAPSEPHPVAEAPASPSPQAQEPPPTPPGADATGASGDAGGPAPQ